MSNIEKNDLNRPEKAQQSIKIKILSKLPRIDMEIFEVGKNCKRFLKKSPKIYLLNVKKEQKFKNMI
jgi:hypothetical protein